MKQKPNSFKSLIQWAYFAPDGYCQVRSISDTREMARKMICKHEYGVTYKDYESEGFTLHKIELSITII